MLKEYVAVKEKPKFNSLRRAQDNNQQPRQTEEWRRRVIRTVAVCASKKSWNEPRLGRHRRTILRVGEQNFFLCGEPLRENDRVSERTRDCRDPGGVNQREKKHFQKNRGVIWMANVGERASRDDPELGRVHHLDVPVLAERSNDPPTNHVRDDKKNERDRGEPGNERAVKKNDFNCCADENQRVQQNHPQKFRVGDFCSAVGNDLLLMAFRNLQLDDAQRSDRQQ